jgi:hypothetical protein
MMILIKNVKKRKCPNCGDEHPSPQVCVEVEWYPELGQRVSHPLCLHHLKCMLEGLHSAMDEKPSVRDAMRAGYAASSEKYISASTISMIFAVMEKAVVEAMSRCKDEFFEKLN